MKKLVVFIIVFALLTVGCQASNQHIYGEQEVSERRTAIDSRMFMRLHSYICLL